MDKFLDIIDEYNRRNDEECMDQECKEKNKEV